MSYLQPRPFQLRDAVRHLADADATAAPELRRVSHQPRGAGVVAAHVIEHTKRLLEFASVDMNAGQRDPRADDRGVVLGKECGKPNELGPRASEILLIAAKRPLEERDPAPIHGREAARRPIVQPHQHVCLEGTGIRFDA